MQCPHCHKAVHVNFSTNVIYMHGHPTDWHLTISTCPACREAIIYISKGNSSRRLIEPAFPTRATIPSQVPNEIAEDYREACAVLSISPKASAALSRRCLQSILNAQGYTERNLAKQVDNALAETDARKAMSPALSSTVDAIRNFGNFSAHPIDDKTTNQIIPVEAHEAEFCLEIIEEMFDHYYVRPAIAAKRKAALDAKLAAAGKPPSK